MEETDMPPARQSAAISRQNRVNVGLRLVA
jgi:hypothetical protein